jgi:DNA repair protein RadC
MKQIFKSRLQLVKEEEIFYSPKINSSESVNKYSEFARSMFNDGSIELREEFFIILLNRANEVIGCSKISEGGYSGTIADGKMIFSTALLHTNANAIILAHNHPSGQLKPSDTDIRLTNKLVQFGEMIDLPILDHLIITAEGYYSFADEGQL